MTNTLKKIVVATPYWIRGKQSQLKRLPRPLLVLAMTFIYLFVVQPAFVQSADNPFGSITNPLPGGSLGPGGGLIVLLNNVLRLIFVVAGIFAFLRVITGGLGFINAGGDSKKIEQAWNSIWQSLLGLTIIISSIAIAALIGIILFGSAGAILNPKIYGPGAAAPDIPPGH